MKPGTIMQGGFTYVKDIALDKIHTNFKKHHRLKVFHHKGFKCVSCHRIGSRLVISKDKAGGIHIDVYTHNYQLMTIDHIIPKSKGGHKTHIDNLQPMCYKCNCQKSNTMPDGVVGKLQTA